jgi:hypothetical protein
MSESQIAEALHSVLDEEAAGVTARPDAAHLARRHGRRRRVARGLMAGVPALALVAGGAALAAHGAGAASPAAPHPAVLDAAYLTKHVESQLSSSNYLDKYVIENTVTPNTIPGTSHVNWYDPATGNAQTADKSAKDSVTTWATFNANQPYKLTVVDTAAKTVSTSFSTLKGSARPEPTPTVLLPGHPPRLFALGPDLSASQLKAMAKGGASIVGKGVVDGQPVIDLRPSTGTRMVYDYWVTPGTFQLLKVVERTTDETGTTYTSTADFLPKTKSLAAQVNIPQIPPGFSRASSSK